MKRRMITVLVAAQLFLTVNNVSAQKETSLDPITVTSSLVEKRASETGRNITIIKGEVFSKLPVHSLDELLKYIPGIEVQMRGPQGSQSDISIRGGTFQQVLVILDGLRLNDPNTGHFSGYIPIAPAEIERIEILKGASSAIYGSDAVGGVINVITKAFSSKNKTNGMQASGTFAAGEYNYLSGNAGIFYKNDKLAISAGVLSNNSKGVLQRGTRGYFHNTGASVGTTVNLNSFWSLSYRMAYDNRDFSAQNFYTTFSSDTASEKIWGLWQQGRVSYQKNNTKINFDAGYKILNDQYRFTPNAAANNNTSRLLQGLLTWQQYFSTGSTVLTGFNFQQKNITSNDRGNHTVNIAAPFASLVQQIGSYVMLQPSLRVEFIGNNRPEVVPQLTFSYKKDFLQLRASGGKTIRDADFTERYNNYNKKSVSSGRIGNPSLFAEKSWSYEAGGDLFFNTVKISTTFFQRFHTQLIDWITTPYADMPRKDNLIATGTYALAKNIATVNTTGWETDVQYSHSLSATQSISLNGGYVWLYSKSSEAQPSFYINSHAKFLANFSTTYTFGNAMVSLTGIYKSRQPQQASPINAFVSKDYFLLNGRASYSFMQNRLGAFVQADNIFNRQYSDLLGAPMPGRWLQAGITFNFLK